MKRPFSTPATLSLSGGNLPAAPAPRFCPGLLTGYIMSTSLLPGEYELSAGMYDTETIERLPVYDPAGNLVPEARVVLGTIRVTADE